VSTGISHSRAEAYLSCRRKDWYGYQFPTEEGKGIRRIGASSSLNMGTAIHSIAEVYYNSIMDGEDRETARAVAEVEYADIMAEFEDRGGNYATLEEVKNRFLDNETLSDDHDILGVEMEFNLQTEDGEFPFKVDILVRERDTGLIYVVDNKTGYYLYTEEQTEIMPQIPKYVGALRALGYKVAGGKYQIIRTQKLGGEKMLKAELVAVLSDFLEVEENEHYEGKPMAKHTVEILQGFAEAHGIEHTKPVDPAKVYQVLDVDIPLDRVMQTMVEQFDVAEELRERDSWPAAEQEKRAYRTANQTVCKSCNFRLICVEELRGGNSNLVLGAEYEPKPKRDRFEVSEEIDDDDAA
jgi:hypothetical protein